MTASSNAIDIFGISKRYRTVQALKDVTFLVPRESVACILGPNGAGKTTLLRILTTVTHPDDGYALIEGHHLFNSTEATRQLIGVVAQENRFDRYLSIWHNLVLHAQMHGLSRTETNKRLQELLEQVGLYDRRSALPDELSGGMQRRVALIRALIHHPKILFLDEPSTGLDPQARLEIWRTIEQFKKHATVVLTTHYMEEADRLSDSIILMNKGRVVSTGTPQSLKLTLTPKNKYEVILRQPESYVMATRLNVPAMRENGILSAQAQDAFSLHIELASPQHLPFLFQQIDPAELVRIGLVEADLEDVFMALAEANPAILEGKT